MFTKWRAKNGGQLIESERDCFQVTAIWGFDGIKHVSSWCDATYRSYWNVNQLEELKHLQKESEQLRRAVANLTLEMEILKEAAWGNFWVPLVVILVLTMFDAISKSQISEPVGCWGNIVLCRDIFQEGMLMKTDWLLIFLSCHVSLTDRATLRLQPCWEVQADLSAMIVFSGSDDERG